MTPYSEQILKVWVSFLVNFFLFIHYFTLFYSCICFKSITSLSFKWLKWIFSPFNVMIT